MCRAGLPAIGKARRVRPPVPCARAVHHFAHGLDDVFPVLDVPDLHVFRPYRRQHLTSAGGDFDRLHQARRVRHAASPQHRGTMRQLQRGRQHIALADAGDDGFATVPGLVVLLSFPRPRRYQSRPLVGQVDTGELAETEQTEELCMRSIPSQCQIVKQLA